MRTPQNDIVLALTKAPALPAAGASIEVAGLPETTLYSLLLNHAVWRPTADTGVTEEGILEVTAEDLTTGVNDKPRFYVKIHGRVVRIRGVICGLPRANPAPSGDNILYLEDAGRIIPVNVDAARSVLDTLVLGSKVEATGICVINAPVWSPNSGFPNATIHAIVTRDANDIRVLSHPPWLTTGRMFVIVGVLVAVIVGVLIWNFALRIVSERRGQALAREQVKRIESDLKVQERTRLAVELHDSLAQDLGGLALEIKTALATEKDDHEKLSRHLRIVDKALQSCNDELRHCLWNLRSQALDGPNLSQAILRTLKPHIRGEKVSVRCNVPRHLLSDHMAYTMLRIIRELVINAIRHGKARHIRIAGCHGDEKLRFSVTDDGIGFDPAAAPGVLQGHFGISGVRERAEQMNGSFEIDSSPGRGARAIITLAFSEQA